MPRTPLRTLADVYAALPRVDCRGLCHGFCGHVGAHPPEMAAMEVVGGPFVSHGGTRCGYLTAENRCGVYDHRPLMCRAFGVTKKLRCPFGCVPDRWLSHAEARELWRAMDRMFGQGEMAAVVP